MAGSAVIEGAVLEATSSVWVDGSGVGETTVIESTMSVVGVFESAISVVIVVSPAPQFTRYM